MHSYICGIPSSPCISFAVCNGIWGDCLRCAPGVVSSNFLASSRLRRRLGFLDFSFSIAENLLEYYLGMALIKKILIVAVTCPQTGGGGGGNPCPQQKYFFFYLNLTWYPSWIYTRDWRRPNWQSSWTPPGPHSTR